EAGATRPARSLSAAPPPADARVGGVQAADDLAQGAGLRRHFRRAAGVGAQDRGNAARDAHQTAAPSNPAAWKAATVGLIAAGTDTAGATASRVFRPSPELMI